MSVTSPDAHSTWNELTKSDFAKVVFSDLFHLNEDHSIGCRFLITANVTEDPSDFIGLFRVGYENLSQFLASKPLANIIHNKSKILLCIFSREELPELEDGFYQFLYVSKDQEICGASTPFEIKKEANCKSCEEEEVSDDGFLIVDTSATKLKNLKSEMEVKNALIKQQEVLLKNNADIVDENRKKYMEIIKYMEEKLETSNRDMKQKSANLEMAHQKLFDLKKNYDLVREELWERQNEEKKVLEEKKAEIKQTSDALIETADLLESVKDENSHLKENISEKEKIIEKLEEEKNDVIETLKQVNANMEEKEAEINSLTSSLKKTTDQLVSVNNELDDRVLIISELESVIQTLLEDKKEALGYFEQMEASQEENIAISNKEKKTAEILKITEERLFSADDEICKLIRITEDLKCVNEQLTDEKNNDLATLAKERKAFKEMRQTLKAAESQIRYLKMLTGAASPDRAGNDAKALKVHLFCLNLQLEEEKKKGLDWNSAYNSLSKETAELKKKMQENKGLLQMQTRIAADLKCQLAKVVTGSNTCSRQVSDMDEPGEQNLDKSLTGNGNDLDKTSTDESPTSTSDSGDSDQKNTEEFTKSTSDIGDLDQKNTKEMEDKIDELVIENRKLQSHVKEKTDVIEKMSDKIHDLESNCAMWADEVHDLQSYCAELRNKLDDNENNTKKIKEDIIRKEAVIECMAKDKTQLLHAQFALCESLKEAAELYKKQYLEIRRLQKKLKKEQLMPGKKANETSARGYSFKRNNCTPLHVSEGWSGIPNFVPLQGSYRLNDSDTGEQVPLLSMNPKRIGLDFSGCFKLGQGEDARYRPELNSLKKTNSELQKMIDHNLAKLVATKCDHRNEDSSSSNSSSSSSPSTNPPNKEFLFASARCEDPYVSIYPHLPKDESFEIGIPCECCKELVEVNVMTAHMENEHKLRSCPFCGLFFSIDMPLRHFYHHLDKHYK